jgi:hypothetical protein
VWSEVRPVGSLEVGGSSWGERWLMGSTTVFSRMGFVLPESLVRGGTYVADFLGVLPFRVSAQASLTEPPGLSLVRGVWLVIVARGFCLAWPPSTWCWPCHNNIPFVPSACLGQRIRTSLFRLALSCSTLGKFVGSIFMHMTTEKSRTILAVKANCDDIQGVCWVFTRFVGFGTSNETTLAWPC